MPPYELNTTYRNQCITNLLIGATGYKEQRHSYREDSVFFYHETISSYYCPFFLSGNTHLVYKETTNIHNPADRSTWKTMNGNTGHWGNAVSYVPSSVQWLGMCDVGKDIKTYWKLTISGPGEYHANSHLLSAPASSLLPGVWPKPAEPITMGHFLGMEKLQRDTKPGCSTMTTNRFPVEKAAICPHSLKHCCVGDSAAPGSSQQRSSDWEDPHPKMCIWLCKEKRCHGVRMSTQKGSQKALPKKESSPGRLQNPVLLWKLRFSW